MASKKFNNVYIKNSFSLAGPVEKQGSIKDYDLVMDDYYFQAKTFEQAEIKMQKTVIDNLLNRSKLINSEVDLLVSGDLSNQISVSSYAASNYSIPFFGVYSACASFVQSLITGADFLDNKRKLLHIIYMLRNNLDFQLNMVRLSQLQRLLQLLVLSRVY